MRGLALGRDYETDDEHRNVFLLEAGIERLEATLGHGSLFAADNQHLLDAIHCALHAAAPLRRDVDYVVRHDKIEIVDEFTGRVVDQRHWPDGLQAAVEAREGIAQRSQGRILGSITLQHFFRLYPALAGMTATARSAGDELREFYGLATVIVPPHAPSRPTDYPDAIFSDKAARRDALLREIRAQHAAGRPILVGAASVRESEELASDLAASGFKGVVLNAKNDQLEANIIANAGLPGAVTISTNMAGRGTDIKLGGADERERRKAVELDGLYVIGTSRHESVRIDRQLCSRAGRQGDPGATRFLISLEDDLFERYGLTKAIRRRHRVAPQQGELATGLLFGEIEHAQRVIEGQTFDIRRRLTDYSALVEVQRRIVHERRDAILDADGRRDGQPDALTIDSPAGILASLDPVLPARGLVRFGHDRLARIERRAALVHLDRLWAEHLAWVQDTRDSIHLVRLGGMTPIDEFRKAATAEFLELQGRINGAVVEEMRSFIDTDGPDDPAIERLHGPSATWTYLISDDMFSLGTRLTSWMNIGAAASTAFFMGPLLVLTLLIDPSPPS